MTQTWHLQVYQTRDNIFVDETCVNAQKEHLVMAKLAPLPATRDLMGEFDRVKIAKKNVKQKKETLHNEGEQHEDEREQLHYTNCTTVSHNINHDINITSSCTSNIHHIQLDETPADTETEDLLSSNEEVEAQVQTKKNTRQYRKRQTTECRIHQMHQYRVRKQQEEWLPIARQNLEDFNETTVNCHDVGSMDNICSACGALMFKDEKTCWKVKSK